ncbi:MAG: hypothetical protein NT157_03885 [Candidatus Micrarchaeota archaeon]|nr:hypothetical protein [Candidatus Micrarchaeota archaeon]
MDPLLCWGIYFVIAFGISVAVSSWNSPKWGLILATLFLIAFFYLNGLLFFGCCSAVFLLIPVIAGALYKE